MPATARSRGFILVEVTIAYLVLSLALVALLPVFILAIRAGKNTEQLQVATYLSQELLEEVRMRRWDARAAASPRHIDSPSAVLGPDPGETATNKTTFDDVDDFNGWTEAAARDSLNVLLPAFSVYSRTVAVSYVDSNLAASATPTDYKKVTVCTRTKHINPLCLQTVVTNR
jgi:type II secretory pathway pseudopilin PulG